MGSFSEVLPPLRPRGAAIAPKTSWRQRRRLIIFLQWKDTFRVIKKGSRYWRTWNICDACEGLGRKCLQLVSIVRSSGLQQARLGELLRYCSFSRIRSVSLFPFSAAECAGKAILEGFWVRKRERNQTPMSRRGTVLQLLLSFFSSLPIELLGFAHQSVTCQAGPLSPFLKLGRQIFRHQSGYKDVHQ